MDVPSRTVLNFSHYLLKQLMKSEKNENIFFSPVCICTLLEMVMLGASGNTKSQIEKALHVSQEHSSSTKDSEGLQSIIKELLSNQKDKKYELTIVNGFFEEKTFPFLDNYVQRLKDEYNTDVQAVDFQNNAEAETEKINEWVKSNTNGKIPELYGKGSLDGSSVLALVNTICFKGQWEDKFDPKNTKEGIFHINKNEKKTITMMSKSGKFKLASLSEMKCKVLKLPYQQDISMMIALPDEIEGIKELMSTVTPDFIISWAAKNNLTETELDILFPKFKLEGSYPDMGETLKELGITDLFEPNADLSGMSNKKGLFVSNAVHKAFIEVDEEGTEAAAATGDEISVTSLPLRIPFNVDHPFLFCLVENKNFLILFKGVVFCP